MWPLGVLSAYDPPVLRDIPGLVRSPRSKLAIAWNQRIIRIAKQVMKPMFAGYLNPLRISYGLGKIKRTPVLDFQLEPALVLGLYSAYFAPRLPDMPQTVDLTGFPLIEDSAYDPDPKLDEFMESEPIVFTLGSILSESPGSFYEASIAAAEQLGKRALILSRKPIPDAPSKDILIRGYVPHSRVFPKAQVNVHHGGIGTTARASIAGKPQLVVPHFGDQPDNAARLLILGVSGVLSSGDYTASSARSTLSDILRSETLAAQAAELGNQLKNENSAARAAQSTLNAIA